MACFITPLLTGIVVLIVSKLWRGANKLKLHILTYLLLGGSLVLAVEHLWHGEIAPYPPFLTAMRGPEDIPVVLNELGAVGGSMTLSTLALWCSILALSREVKIKGEPPLSITTTLERGD